jgi:hypothetical protein
MLGLFVVQKKSVKNVRYEEQYRKISSGWNQLDSMVPMPSFSQWHQAMSLIEDQQTRVPEEIDQGLALRAIESAIIHLGICNLALVHLPATNHIEGGAPANLQAEQDAPARHLSLLVGQQLGLNSHYRERLQGLAAYYLKQPGQVLDVDAIIADYVPQQRLKIALDEIIREVDDAVGTVSLNYDRAMGMLEGAGAVMVASTLCDRDGTRAVVNDAKKNLRQKVKTGLGNTISKWAARIGNAAP